MKTIKLTIFAAVMVLATLAQGQTTYSFTNNVNLTVPDANPTGVTASTNVSGVIGYVSSVTVVLDITGGFNGDLYAYLVDPNGNLAVLLNRPGISASGGNSFGYSDAGFNIVLTSGSNIHNYQSGIYNLSGGQLTGTWAADGRNINPQSTPTVFDSAATSADLSLFNNDVPNGQWTLFIADLSGGSQSTLVSWGLTVVTVPEPQTWAMVAGGLGMLLAVRRRAR